MMRKLLVSSALTTILLTGACSTAQADDWGFIFSATSNDIIDCTGPQRVWVEPIYETRCENVWIEPVVQRVCENVWVPDRYEWRSVPAYDDCGRVVYMQQQVCVERGHWTTVEREVIVQAGYWSSVERQVCVREGYWVETPGVQSGFEIAIGYDGYDGYDKGYDRGGYDRNPYGRNGNRERYDSGGNHDYQGGGDHRWDDDRENRSQEPRYQSRDRRSDDRGDRSDRGDRGREDRSNRGGDRRDGGRDRGDRYR